MLVVVEGRGCGGSWRLVMVVRRRSGGKRGGCILWWMRLGGGGGGEAGEEVMVEEIGVCWLYMPIFIYIIYNIYVPIFI